MACFSAFLFYAAVETGIGFFFVSSSDMPARLLPHTNTYILICLLMVTGTTFGQTKLFKNAFVGPHLEYLEFRNDTSLVTTLNYDWDTAVYLIKSDTLMVKKEHWEYRGDGVHHWLEWRPYKLLTRQRDSIRMLVPPKAGEKSAGSPDTLTLVCLEDLREPIHSFTYFNITEEGPFFGTIDITIDSTGRLVYYRKIRNPADTTNKTTNQLSTRLLSKQEFSQFKNVLSHSLLSKLRRFRGGCDAMDAGRSTIEIVYNGRKVISRGCTMNWPEGLLYSHIYNLATRNVNRAGSKHIAADDD
jgi:hypothetical protein